MHQFASPEKREGMRFRPLFHRAFSGTLLLFGLMCTPRLLHGQSGISTLLIIGRILHIGEPGGDCEQ